MDVLGETQTTSTPKLFRYGTREMIPGTSPHPSPLLSWKEAGYTGCRHPRSASIPKNKYAEQGPGIVSNDGSDIM